MQTSWNIPAVTDKVKQRLPDIMGLIGQAVAGAAKQLVTVETGNLRNSITYTVINGKTARVGSPVEYASYIELGTKPHVILPKNKKVLAFKIGGNWVFSKKVNHPGTQAHPFLRPAVYNNKDLILSFFKDKL